MASRGGSGGDLAPASQLPTNFGNLMRACRRCRLVKTFDQFRETGCENCPFFEIQYEHERIVACTTRNFSGIISTVDLTKSWAAGWLRIGKLVPGCYTLAVSEALPPDFQIICEEEGVPYVPPKRSSQQLKNANCLL